MPMVSYLTFSDRDYYKVMDYTESLRYIEEYEEAYCRIENDILQMLDIKHLFFDHFEGQYRNVPCVQVW
jgi:hypothetical protein